MASASNSKYLYSGAYPSKYPYTLAVSFTENSYNVGTNKSSVTVSSTFSASQNWWETSHQSTLEIIWYDNYTKTEKIVGYINFAGLSGQYDSKSTSATFDVQHNSDGSLSGYAKAVFTKGNTTTSYACNSGSVSTATTKLTDIPRQANITSAPNFNDEESPIIKYSNPAGNSVSSLQACISLDGSNADISYRDISKTGTSYTFNLTEDERNILRKATTSNSRTVKFYVRTIISGNTFYSILSKTFTIINGNPTFEDYTYKDTNSQVTSVTGNDQILVKGLSTLEVTISAENKMIANKQSTPKNYSISIDNITKSVDYSTDDLIIDVGNISSNGTKRLTVRAYDSRNNSIPVEKDIIIYDYENPVINASIKRLNNFEDETTLKINGSITNLVIDDEEKNAIIKVGYRYRETNGTWSNWISIDGTITNNEIKCNDVVLSLDKTKSFDFEVRLVDNLTTTILPLIVDSGQSIFFISSNNEACYINGQEILMYDIVEEWED